MISFVWASIKLEIQFRPHTAITCDGVKRVSLNGVWIPKPKTEDTVKVFQSIETIAKTPFSIYLRIELTQNDQDADDNKMN